ncbi:MAG: hypothetical protein SFV17_21730 [Candidatus Obscuribacter sp.]|nr:hypothetical protein [Candidatus Obscuribacter sp.]
MSLRLWVSALKLQDLKDWRGCKKKKLITELLAKMEGILPEGTIEEDDEQLKELVAEKIAAYINGTAEEQKEPETNVEVITAYSMAQQAETNPWGENEVELEWPYGDMDELYRDCRSRFQDAEHLLEHILNGRPLFGEEFDPEAGWYAYLTNGEIQDLATKMQEVYNQCAAIVDSGALNKQDFESGVVDTMEYMLGTLKVAAESGDDIFIFAS